MNKQLRIKIIIGAVLLAVCGVALLLMALKKKSNENLTLETVEYELQEGEVMLILENEVDSDRALKRGESIYIPYTLAKEKINGDFYDDEDEDDVTLTYVLPKEIIRLTPDQPYYMSNDTRITPVDPILIEEYGELYIEINFLASVSDMRYEYYEDPDRLILHYEWKDFLYYEMADKTPVHVEPDVSSGISMMLSKGSKVYYIGGYGNRKDDFIKIMTENGLFGFVQRKHVGASQHEYQASSYVEPEPAFILNDEKVKLGWWYVASTVGNATYSECIRNAKGSMNVISPTWISLADNNGAIRSFAESRYVQRAHADGFKVWILVDFPDGVVSPHQNLSRNSARDVLIKNLVDEAVRVGADGLNIDFEALSEQTGVHFVQFIKELSVRCHEKGLVLSVDNLVISKRTAHYDIESQAKFADYIVMMTYDEHYASSKEAGSVASIGFVRDSITAAAEVCDRERILMGIPFYTRRWMLEGGALTNEALTMIQMEDFIDKKKQSKIFDATTCQNYVEFMDGVTLNRIWCEDATSVAYKCADAVSGQLGGVACWRLGQETDDVWTIINTYIK